MRASTLRAVGVAFIVVLPRSGTSVGGVAPAPPCASFETNLTNLQVHGLDWIAATDSSPDECKALCCTVANCTTWNIQIKSTDPDHHPRVCWLSAAAVLNVTASDAQSEWAGGSRGFIAGPPPPHDPRPAGATIAPLAEWFYYKAAGTTPTLLKELTDQSVAVLRARAANVSRLGTSPSQWIHRVSQARRSFEQVFAPLPPDSRQPPSFKVVGTLTRPGHTCQKILYETRPGFWVPAALWTPTGPPGPRRPGILLVSGHTPDGFRSNNLGGDPQLNAPGDDDYQTVQINLVERGFVVLAFDPIGQGERMQYADLPEGRPSTAAPWSEGADGAWLWSSTADHEYIGRQLQLSGVGLMSFWLHDETVSLDLLASLPSVNPEWLGVVGCSGGGTQSSYLAAMDPRIKAASIACYTSTFEIDRLWAAAGGSDGEQTWPHGISLGLDKPDLLEVRANLSTQVLITTADTCFPAAGGLAAVNEAAQAYSALGGTLDMFEGVWHHGWVLPTREQIYGYFCKALGGGFGGGQAPPSCHNNDELNVSAGSPAAEWTDTELRVTSTGQVATAPECGGSSANPAATVHTFSSQMAQGSLDALAAKRARAPQAFVASVRASAAAVSGFVDLDATAPPRFLGGQFAVPHPPEGPHPGQPPAAIPLGDKGRSSADLTTGLVERWMLFGEGGCFTTLTLFFPYPVTDMMSPRPTNVSSVVIYQRAGVDLSAGVPEPVAAVVAAGHIAAVAEVCGLGESGDAFATGLTGLGMAAEDMATELGRSVPGFMAGDMARVHRYLTSRSDVHGIALAIAMDYLDVALLHAALASPQDGPTRLAIVGPRATLGRAATERIYQPVGYFSWIFGLLKHYDLSDAVAAVATAADVLVLGPLDGASLTALNASTATEAYSFGSQVAPRGSGSLSVMPGTFTAVPATLAALRWLHGLGSTA